ncbi:LOW QUALITY PROTEIN: hypothetical protein HID58_002721, partial [Brassica napus]
SCQCQRCHSRYSYGGDYATLTISADKKSTPVSLPPESDSKSPQPRIRTMVKDPTVTTGSGDKKVKIDNHHTAIGEETEMDFVRTRESDLGNHDEDDGGASPV